MKKNKKDLFNRENVENPYNKMLGYISYRYIKC